MEQQQGKESRLDRRNKFTFGVGTIGRDMFYSMVSMFLMVYLTEILGMTDQMLWWVTGIFTALRVFDAVNDPIMGVVVDNTKSRWGKFKPWIFIGGVASAVLMVLMFADTGLQGTAFLVVFALLYLGWDILYGLNDIAYWSMLPSLSLDQKEREKIGSFARICANIGLFAVVVAVIPVTEMLAGPLGGEKNAWFLFAAAVAVIMIGTISVTVFGVRERKGVFKQEEKTTLKDMFKVIVKNDQLLWVALSMAIFTIGYITTTSFGVYYFTYIYGDEGMYSIFAVVLGVSQILALAVFPAFSKKFTRKQLYTAAMLLVVGGYIIFFFAPPNMLPIGIAGVMLFAGQAFIQLLMLMFLADTIEYGQWKLGKRNESVTFSVQPFINKIGGAVGTGILGVTLILSGVNAASGPADVTPGGAAIFKSAMMLIPLALIVLSYVIYVKKYKLDEKTYAKIVAELEERGDIREI